MIVECIVVSISWVKFIMHLMNLIVLNHKSFHPDALNKYLPFCYQEQTYDANESKINEAL